MEKLNDPSAWLCHYTRAETAFAKILPSGELLMNPYERMRDPLENKKPYFRSVSGWGDDREGQERMFWRLMAEVSHSRDPMRLLSLTLGEPGVQGGHRDALYGCPWARPRMWEQYAENHAGACLVFDRPSLLDRLRSALGAIGSYWEGPVHYEVGGFASSRAAMGLFEHFNEATLADDVARYVQQHYEDYFFRKTTDWTTECEYRFVLEPASENGDAAESTFVSYGDALCCVVVGERFPRWQVPGAAAVAEAAGVELRFMSWELGMPWPAQRPPRDEPTVPSPQPPASEPAE